MLEPKDIERLEKRASNAINGYAGDVNITVYVYGADVTSLLNHLREVNIEKDKWQMLAEERERRQPGMPPPAETREAAAVPNGLKELPEQEEPLAVATPGSGRQPRKKVGP